MSQSNNNRDNKKDDNNQDNQDNQKKIDLQKESLEMSIKQVLKKKRISIVKPKEDQILDLISDELGEGIKTVQNPKLLLYFLLNTPVFKQYTYINRFPKENLISSFKLGKYVKLKKNTILFKQGDKTDLFYLVLSGSIGFILTTYDDNILKTNPHSREVNSIKVGSYFGEWGLIYKINRTVSAYAKEDTLLLGFDKYTFRNYYQNNIIFYENNTKKFVLNHIKTFKDFNETFFNLYYREIKKIYCIPGQEIFIEGTKAESFYLVYMGSCAVRKGLNNIIIKDSGDFIGIESLYIEEYENSVYPNADGTVLFKFLLNSFNKTIVANLKNEFSSYYKKQKEILKVSTNNYNRYKDKYEMNYINLLENLRRNKVKNRRNMNKINMDEIRINYNMIEPKQYSSPYKYIKYFKLTNINNLLQKNNIESSNTNLIKAKNINNELPYFKYIKSSIETQKNLKNIDTTNNSNSLINLENSKCRNNLIPLNRMNSNKNSDMKRPFSSLNKENKKPKKLNLPKKKYNFFNDEEDNHHFIKRKQRDNHFSSQNFRVPKKTKLPLFKKKKNIKSKNKSTNNLREKQFFKPIFISCKDIMDISKKLENKKKVLKNNYSQCDIEETLKSKISEKYIEQENENSCSNYEIPLMVIRNVSSYSPKIF